MARRFLYLEDKNWAAPNIGLPKVTGVLSSIDFLKFVHQIRNKFGYKKLRLQQAANRCPQPFRFVNSDTVSLTFCHLKQKKMGTVRSGGQWCDNLTLSGKQKSRTFTRLIDSMVTMDVDVFHQSCF